MACSDSLDLALGKLRAKTMHYANLLVALIFSKICNISYLSKRNILIFIKEKMWRKMVCLSLFKEIRYNCLAKILLVNYIGKSILQNRLII